MPADVAADALLLLADGLLGHERPVHKVGHRLFGEIDHGGDAAAYIGSDQIRQAGGGGLPVQVHGVDTAGRRPGPDNEGIFELAVPLSQEDADVTVPNDFDIRNTIAVYV